MDKIFETNCSFHVKLGTTEKVQFLLFRILLLAFEIFWEEDGTIGYNSMKF